MRAHHAKRAFALLLAALTLVFARAQARAGTRPRLIVFLCPGFTTDDLSRPDLPRIRKMASEGTIGLMNVAAPQRDLATSLLTLSLGDHMAAEAGDDEILRADAGPVDEGTAAGGAFVRRTALPLPPADRLVHLGIGPLTRRGQNTRLLGARLRSGSRWVVFILGNPTDRQPAGLLLVDTNGLGPRAVIVGEASGVTTSPDAAHALADASVNVLVHCPSVSDVEATLAAPTFPANADVIVCPLPTPDWSIGRKRLPPVLCSGPSWPHGILTSATTRTPGLVANIDLAPTILAHAGVDLDAGEGGHPWLAAPGGDPLGKVRHLDRVVATNEAALVPVFAILGLICAAVVFGGLLTASRKGSTKPYRLAALALLTMPLAMLLAVFARVETLPALAAAIGTLMMALGAAAATTTRKRPLCGPPIVMGVTAVVILLDAVLGLHLVKFSMFSGYQLQGIRFYGIGNEYMGVLIGCVLFAVSFWSGHALARVGLLGCALCVLGHPALGAKAGGIIVGAAALGMGIELVRGKTPRWRGAAIWTVGGIAAAFGVAWLERLTSGAASSHLGSALASAEVQGGSYLAEIVLRKAEMNFRIATNPIMITAAVLAALALWLAARRLDSAGGPWADTPTRRDGFRAAGLVALVAFLFNDSGAVAAIFIVGPFIMGFLHDVFAASEVAAPEGA